MKEKEKGEYNHSKIYKCVVLSLTRNVLVKNLWIGFEYTMLMFV